jgi:hypothetical protein
MKIGVYRRERRLLATVHSKWNIHAPNCRVRISEEHRPSDPLAADTRDLLLYSDSVFIVRDGPAVAEIAKEAYDVA